MSLVALPILVTVLVSAINYFQGNDYYAPDAWPQDVPIDQLLNEYDFIVVGSGSAGVSFRLNDLTETSKCKIQFRCCGS